MTDRRPTLFTPGTAPPTAGYVQIAIVPAGRTAFISGQVGVDRDWQLAPGLRAQTEHAFRNLEACIAACGASLADVAKLTVYAVGDADLATYAAVRDEVFAAHAVLPASTFVRVAGLYHPDALIEIEAVVALPG